MTDRTPGAPAPVSAQRQLIPVFAGQLGGLPAQVCDGRTLHTFLENGDLFANWIKDRVAKYGFVEDQDFTIALVVSKAKKGGQNRKDYHLSLDMAKELAMVENNARGREARRYFIACERQALAAMALPSRPAIVGAQEDAWTQRIRTYLDQVLAETPPPKRPRIFVPMAELLALIDLDPRADLRPERTRIGLIVRALGWVRIRPGTRTGARHGGYRPGPRVLGQPALPASSDPLPRAGTATAPALPPPADPITREVRAAIHRRAHALSLRHYDRLCTDLAEAVRKHAGQPNGERDLVRYVELVDTPDSSLVVVHGDDLWSVTAMTAAMVPLLDRAMAVIHALERATGQNWYGRPGRA